MVFRTPIGRFRIQSKEENPVWVPPDWHYIEEAQKNGLDVVRLNRGQCIADVCASGNNVFMGGAPAVFGPFGGTPMVDFHTEPFADAARYVLARLHNAVVDAAPAPGRHLHVHLLEPGAPVVEGPSRHDLEVAQLGGGGQGAHCSSSSASYPVAQARCSSSAGEV